MDKKDDVIRAQLTLRGVVWDILDMERRESAKLDREIQHYGILKIETAHGQMRADFRAECGQICTDTQAECGQVYTDAQAECGQIYGDAQAKYAQIQRDLHTAGILETNALLVSDDAGLVKYVYHREQALAAVYYEREDGGKEVSADMVVQGFEEIGVQFLDRVLKRRRRLPWNILYTKRTCVREIALPDLDELYELYAGEGITDYTEPLFEREKEEAYTRSYIDCMYYYYGYGMWIIRDRESGKLVGRAGIEHREEDGEVRMELGYIIGREYQNQGYAAEVCKAVLEYAAQELEIEEMHCFIHPQNLPSIRVAEKLGFTLCSRSGQENLLHFSRKL